jgi:hypothetical protein
MRSSSITVKVAGVSVAAACLLFSFRSSALALSEKAVQPACDNSCSVIWKRQIGRAYDERSAVVATDYAGAVFVGMSTFGASSIYSYQSDVLVTKYSAAGKIIWQRHVGTPESDFTYGVATDAAGNLLIAGETWGSLATTDNYDNDFFIVKYSPDGKLLWKRQFGGFGQQGMSYEGGLATDPSGNVLLAGYTGGAAGGDDIYTDAVIAKYSAAGKKLWIRQFGDTDVLDFAFGVAADPAGNVLTCGLMEAGVDHIGHGFLAKYSSGGKLLWKRKFDKPSGVQSVAADPAGNVLITGGETSGIFIAKYSPAGNLMWKRPHNSLSSVGMATDADSNVIVNGLAENRGDMNAVVAKYSPAGKLLWKRQFGTPAYDEPRSVTTDPEGNVLVGGWTSGSLGGRNKGGWDAFVVKLRP